MLFLIKKKKKTNIEFYIWCNFITVQYDFSLKIINNHHNDSFYSDYYHRSLFCITDGEARAKFVLKTASPNFLKPRATSGERINR